MSDGFQSLPRAAWREGTVTSGERIVAEETPVALVYNASTYAVMMASPLDLEDFAVGFSLTEGVIARASEITAFEVARAEQGVEARIWLDPARAAGLAERRRHVAGPTGCGLCGVESLEAALRPAPRAPETGQRLTPAQILAAMAALGAAQPMNQATRATHAAGLIAPDGRLVAVREDVGRHNALDKLVGAVSRGALAAPGGAVVLTSRVSVEMVQKSAVLGAAFVIAVSAPTTLAIATAEAAGVTLIGVTRADGFEVFTRPDRVAL
jgi:FdhD protein